MLVFENYATFSLSVLYRKKEKRNSEVQIIYLSSIKHEILFILRYILALTKHNQPLDSRREAVT